MGSFFTFLSALTIQRLKLHFESINLNLTLPRRHKSHNLTLKLSWGLELASDVSQTLPRNPKRKAQPNPR